MNLSDDARRLWDAARALNARAVENRALARGTAPVSRVSVADLPFLLFTTDPQRTPAPWETAARLPAGAAVIYRHFGAADAEAVARRLRRVTQDAGVRLLIGQDVDLAARVGADGVHLPERDLATAGALRRLQPGWLLTGAVHSAEAAGATAGLDAMILSPVFPAGGVSSTKAALGAAAFADAVSRTATPVYALGGIDVDNVGTLAKTGACGIAGVAAIQRAFGSA